MRRWLLYLLILITPGLVYAGWTTSPVSINSSPGAVDSHYNSGNRRIVRVGSTVIALVPESTNADHTYRSTNSGASWSEIDTDGSYSGCLITGANDYVYHFYDNGTQIYMVKFLYDGTPGAPVLIQTKNASDAGTYRSIAATVDSTGKLYVMYGAGATYDGLYIITSTDAGANWSGPYTVIAQGTVIKYFPRIECDQANNVLAVYQEWGSLADVWFAKSTDGGVNWTPVLIDASGNANPDILPVSSTVYYVFAQQGVSPYGCVVKKSTDGGANWGSWVTVEASTSTNGYADPSAALGSDGTIYVSYRNDSVAGSGNWREHIASSSDGTTWTVVYDYDEASYRTGTRSHLRYQTWFNHGGQLDWAWMQYLDATPTQTPIYFNTNADVTIYQQDAVVTVPNLIGVTIIGGTIQ